MSDKKSFFELLTPRSAAIVGMVTGILVLGTVGFVVLGIVMLTNKTQAAGPNKAVITAGQQDQVAAQDNTAQEPVAPSTPVVASAPKANKPVAELFVMSYCPYGIQMEQAFVPVMSLLKNKADMTIKFVSYAMHGLKELEENTRQYCLQNNSKDKFIKYMECFVGSQDYKACLATAGVTESQLQSCVDSTNKKFAILDKYNDQSTWLSGSYPLYPVHESLNQKYSVEGSPTLILNGAQVNVARTPEAVKTAICATFDKAPAECSQTLSGGTAATSGGCGT